MQTLGTDAWVRDASLLAQIKERGLQDDPAFRAKFRAIKQQKKAELAAHIKVGGRVGGAGRGGAGTDVHACLHADMHAGVSNGWHLAVQRNCTLPPRTLAALPSSHSAPATQHPTPNTHMRLPSRPAPQARTGYEVSTDALFDIQVKRIHEYKRQFLNAISLIHRQEGVGGAVQAY